MTSSNLYLYGTVALIVLFFAWKKWRAIKMRPIIADYLNKKAVVIDVRSPQEFAGGHFEGSINIPLNTLAGKVSTLDKSRPTIVCCASGARSAVALGILKGQGFEQVINAGPWTNTLISP